MPSCCITKGPYAIIDRLWDHLEYLLAAVIGSCSGARASKVVALFGSDNDFFQVVSAILQE
jgi:3-hydroxyisobutyrate dehydrogenase-like beta-hydroxyacid dehydrogenase